MWQGLSQPVGSIAAVDVVATRPQLVGSIAAAVVVVVVDVVVLRRRWDLLESVGSMFVVAAARWRQGLQQRVG